MAINASRKEGRSKEQGDLLRREYGDLEVRDAVADLRLQILPNDLGNAERKNPGKCALAQGCIRQFDSRAASFFRSLAYVDLVGEDGIRRVERFILPDAARSVVEDFDRGKPIPADGRWLTLKAPSPGKTLEGERKRDKARRKALRTGKATPGPSKKMSSRSVVHEPIEVRNGSGQWQMRTN